MLEPTRIARRRLLVRVGILIAGGTALAATAAIAATNTPPKIWGYARTWANVGTLYNFQPAARDANGNALTFSISGKPAWARFNKSTGRLYGTPTAEYRRTSSTVTIRVSDGAATVSLPTFTLKVFRAIDDDPPPSSGSPATVSWTPPTTNADGTTLTDLAGYYVMYGKDRTALDKRITISNVGVTRYVIEGLASGTWYFGVEAYNRAGEESPLSSLVKKAIP
jgi:hypothetical protein